MIARIRNGANDWLMERHLAARKDGHFMEVRKMPDREKVIKGLECCIIRHPDDKARCDDCPYEEFCCNRLKIDALALLKEHEAVEPRVSTAEQRCGHCNKVIEMDGWKACPWCGKMIDWKRWWNKNGTHDNT